jgi:hypothetical protein
LGAQFAGKRGFNTGAIARGADEGPLAEAAEADQRMMSGKARFQAVLAT